MIACPDCLIRRKPLFRPFSADELSFVTDAKSGQLDYGPREHIVTAGAPGEAMYTVLAGWALRYKALPNGARQILDFLLPGDFFGLQYPLLGVTRHSVKALTQVSVCVIAAEPIRDMFERQPNLAASIVETVLIDEDRADRRLLLLGRQRPTQRLAYLLLELKDRLNARGVGGEQDCDFPLTYEHMADALGLSRAQLARSLAELRDRDWAEVSGGRLALYEADKMAGFCAYDPSPARLTRGLI